MVAASFGPSGAWLSLAAFHERHGTVELIGLPPFDEAGRGDPDAVRAYRLAMTDERHAFLRATFDGELRRRVERGADDEPELVQTWSLEAPDEESHVFELVLRGRIALPALAEITDVSPRPPVDASTSLAADGLALRLEAPDLRAFARISVALRDGSSDGWALDGDDARLVVGWSRRLEVTVRAILGEDPSRTATSRPRRARADLERRGTLWCEDVPLHAATRQREGLAQIAGGAVRYVSGCALLRTGPGEACLLTDHRLLPLSWTRDAYYEALLLLAAGGRAPEHLGDVADHLRWLWGRCERPNGIWQRSHLPNGAPKDIAFQLDQQLFPVLELLDFHQATGVWPAPPGEPTTDPGRAWGRLVTEVWGALPLSPTGLVATQENAADDPSALPYSLSSQILRWYVARRLARVAAELGLAEAELREAAARTRDAIDRMFEIAGPAGTQWAYEVDGQGASRLYADANDMPTAFAPAWGFCPPDDTRWRATMRFAFGEANPAYRPGSWGGLGSLHTPGTWPLGDVQEWVFASLVGVQDRAERALDRLVGVAAGDGLLPEAYDPATGAWTARHWFAWPAAVTGALAFALLDQP